MPRTFHWKWLGTLALMLGPTLALAQGAPAQSHTVREGDTLWDLAKHYSGDPFLWPDIYRINTDVVEDPHWIYPGEVLRLAAADSVTAVPTTDTPEPAPEPVAAADSAPAGEPMADEPVADEAVAGQESLAQLTAASANDAGDGEYLFGRPHTGKIAEESLKAYTHQPYRALRRSEFYSSGFLTENQRLPFGSVLGPTVPQQIRASSVNAAAMPFSNLAVEAPAGATYQIGDTLLVLQLGPELGKRGRIIIPTGLVRVVDTVQGRFVTNLVATYGAIRKGQLLLPAEKFTPSSEAHAVPVTSGVMASLLGGNGRQDLKTPQMVVFIDKGREDGVAAGDLFELRRRAKRLPDGRQLTTDVMATLQIVHVRDHSATARILNILSPDIPPGTDAWQVAKLPS
jgi:hypothetical protein